MSKPKRLTKGQRRKLQGYVDEMLVAMRLTNWTVYVAREMGESDNFAEVNIDGFGPSAAIRFSPLFLTLNRQSQRQTVCHELVHLILARIDHAVEDCTKPMSKGRHKMATAVYVRQVEHATDQLAYMLCEHLPLPPKL